jgi:hypothetical protein
VPTPIASRAAQGLEDRHEQDVAHVETGQDQTRDKGAGVHVADRTTQLVGHDDQHQRGRDDLGEGAGGCNDAGSEPAVVAVAEHDRQRDQAHRDHRGGHHAGGGGQQGADEDHRVGETAADRAKQLADRVEQVFGHAGALKNEAHEGEEGNGEQGVVAHDAEDAVRQGLQEGRVEEAHADAEDGEHEAVGGQREGNGVAGEEKDDEGAEHDRRQVVTDDRDEEFQGHVSFS